MSSKNRAFTLAAAAAALVGSSITEGERQSGRNNLNHYNSHQMTFRAHVSNEKTQIRNLEDVRVFRQSDCRCSQPIRSNRFGNKVISRQSDCGNNPTVRGRRLERELCQRWMWFPLQSSLLSPFSSSVLSLSKR